MTLTQLRTYVETASDASDEIEGIAYHCCSDRAQVDLDKQLDLLRKAHDNLRCGLEEMQCSVAH